MKIWMKKASMKKFPKYLNRKYFKNKKTKINKYLKISKENQSFISFLICLKGVSYVFTNFIPSFVFLPMPLF